MAIGQDMSNVWHNHPYMIMGLGGIVVLYFLWPSSASTAASSTGTGTTDSDYQAQLAAEAGLSQSQLADQTESSMNQSDNDAAIQAGLDQALGASNSAIAEANAATQVSNNQTAQTIATSQADISIAQTAAASTDFTALAAGLTAFGNTSAAVETNPIDTFLNSVGPSAQGITVGAYGWNISTPSGLASLMGSGELPALIAELEGGGSLNESSSTNANSSANSFGIGFGGNGVGGSVFSTGSASSGSSGAFLQQSNTAFQPDLLAGLWSQLITSEPAFVPTPLTTLPTITLPTITAPQMSIQQIPTTTTGD